MRKQRDSHTYLRPTHVRVRTPPVHDAQVNAVRLQPPFHVASVRGPILLVAMDKESRERDFPLSKFLAFQAKKIAAFEVPDIAAAAGAAGAEAGDERPAKRSRRAGGAAAAGGVGGGSRRAKAAAGAGGREQCGGGGGGSAKAAAGTAARGRKRSAPSE
jgi:hypothetical protein